METDQTPYEKLQAAIREYGEAAMENLLRCRAFGWAVVKGLPDYMGCDPRHVALVPAQGPFDPAKNYGDDAFSFDPKQVIRLEPMTFGICVVVPNHEDSGSLWLRTGVRLEISGDSFDVFIAHQPMLRVPLSFEEALGPVFDTVHKEFMTTFCREVAQFKDQHYRDGIGFMP